MDKNYTPDQIRYADLHKKVLAIAEKYADLAEKRIDATTELRGDDLREVYDSIQMLGHIAATLERLSHIVTHG